MVLAGIYHGEECYQIQRTGTVPQQGEGQGAKWVWNENLVFEQIETRDIPPGARLCIAIYAIYDDKSKKKKRKGREVSVICIIVLFCAWVSYSVCVCVCVCVCGSPRSSVVLSKILQTCTLNWQGHPYSNPLQSGVQGTNPAINLTIQFCLCNFSPHLFLSISDF